jgi:hypothetical protein
MFTPFFVPKSAQANEFMSPTFRCKNSNLILENQISTIGNINITF